MFNLKFKTVLFLTILSVFVVPKAGQADIFGFDYSEFAQIPVLEQGRVKPMDSIARIFLKGFNGKDKLKDTQAIEWLAELVFNPEKAYGREVFNIPNHEVVDALNLERREKHRYSYNELSVALQENFALLHPVFRIPEEERTLAQRQLLRLYSMVQVYADLSYSFALVYPLIEVPEGVVADELGVEVGTIMSYMEVKKKIKIFEDLAGEIKKGVENKLRKMNAQDLQLISFVQLYRELDKNKANQILKIIPPQWENKGGTWFSPWSISVMGQGSPSSAQFLQKIKEMGAAYRGGNSDEWLDKSGSLREFSFKLVGDDSLQKRIAMEVKFNNLKLFVNSLVFYLIAFLVVLCGFMFWPNVLRRIAFISLGLGFVLHLIGILMRMYIMVRPPVTNLYESIVFVGFIAVLFGIILEWRKKDNLGILIASSAGVLLHFLGIKYSAEGDTMGMLAAVLDTNFWLATHVVTITIGYGCSFVGGVIGHIYLLTRMFKPKDKARLNDLYKNMLGVSFVALFFAALGTILGGIWADQSWGRFWGWDPKENGALWICLWLIFLIHGRLSGKIKELGYAVGMVITNVIVALAWFGVNLLAVGLHSYGFTDSAAFNLILFCGIELGFALISFAVILKLKK